MKESIMIGVTQAAEMNDEELKTKAYELFKQGSGNLKVSKELEITYEMVVALRISYEKRNAHLSCN